MLIAPTKLELATEFGALAQLTMFHVTTTNSNDSTCTAQQTSLLDVAIVALSISYS